MEVEGRENGRVVVITQLITVQKITMTVPNPLYRYVFLSCDDGMIRDWIGLDWIGELQAKPSQAALS